MPRLGSKPRPLDYDSAVLAPSHSEVGTKRYVYSRDRTYGPLVPQSKSLSLKLLLESHFKGNCFSFQREISLISKGNFSHFKGKCLSFQKELSLISPTLQRILLLPAISFYYININMFYIRPKKKPL
uniref:Uncharacterized protein n=1 Tax=Cacopsylla melanoneura TaxID=428564 RepID=A0A8D8TPZ8_9HEMI